MNKDLNKHLNKHLNIEEIKKILPHRDNMLLLDEVSLDGETACGKKQICGDEWFLQGHFPENPVVPGVILCEILAQSVCVCLEGKIPEGKLPFFTGLDKVKFKNPVKPGDLFETKCQITKVREPFYFAKGEGFVEGKLCVRAEFSFAVTEVK